MAALAPVTATAIVQFNSTDNRRYQLVAELDNRDDGLNSGRTQFDSRATAPQEWPAFLVWAALGVNGKLDVRAHGGTIQVVSSSPSIVTEHKEFITQHVPAGTASAQVSLNIPAAALPSFSGNASVEAAEQTSDGMILSVNLRLAQPAAEPFGTWIIGDLTWRSRAYAYRIQPMVNAEQAILLVVGIPGER